MSWETAADAQAAWELHQREAAARAQRLEREAPAVVCEPCMRDDHRACTRPCTCRVRTTAGARS